MKKQQTAEHKEQNGINPFDYLKKPNPASLKILGTLIDWKVVDVNSQYGGKEQTLLHVVSLKNNPTLIRLLIGKKANPNIVDTFSLGPLHYAAARGLLKNMLALLNGGALVDANKSGKSPLFCLTYHFETKKDPELIKRQADGVELLIKHKAKVDLRPITELSALYLMAASGNFAALMFLAKEDTSTIEDCELPVFAQAAKVVDFVRAVLPLKEIGIFNYPRITQTVTEYVSSSKLAAV